MNELRVTDALLAGLAAIVLVGGPLVAFGGAVGAPEGGAYYTACLVPCVVGWLVMWDWLHRRRPRG